MYLLRFYYSALGSLLLSTKGKVGYGNHEVADSLCEIHTDTAAQQSHDAEEDVYQSQAEKIPEVTLGVLPAVVEGLAYTRIGVIDQVCGYQRETCSQEYTGYDA